MKSKLVFLLLVTLFAAMASCSDRSAKTILDNPEKRDQVLTTIANDSSLLAELHNKMKSGDKMNSTGHSAMMKSCMSMMDDPKMMSMMMDHMMMTGENDSTTCRMMCNKMMNSPNMKSMMEGMMGKEKGTSKK